MLVGIFLALMAAMVFWAYRAGRNARRNFGLANLENALSQFEKTEPMHFAAVLAVPTSMPDVFELTVDEELNDEQGHRLEETKKNELAIKELVLENQRHGERLQVLQGYENGLKRARSGEVH